MLVRKKGIVLSLSCLSTISYIRDFVKQFNGAKMKKGLILSRKRSDEL